MDAVKQVFACKCGCGCGSRAEVTVERLGLGIHIEDNEGWELSGVETLADVAGDLVDGTLRVENFGGLATVEIDAATAIALRLWLVARGVVLPAGEEG